METLKELKAIRDNAPEGANQVEMHSSGNINCYIKYTEKGVFVWHEKEWFNAIKKELGHCWLIRSLSDINRIIELMEINEAMHKQVAGYLAAADWQHWQNFNKSKFEVMK